jgi:hypothetical protein
MNELAAITGIATMILRLAIIVLAGLAGACIVTPSSAGENKDATAQNQNADLSAQQRRPRVRVYRYPQPPFWEYPRPGTYSYPGPNAKRDCRAWYVVENRPSGAVMTPRMRCEWVPG